MKFQQFVTNLDEDGNYPCPSTLSNDELKQGHNELMDCPVNVGLWREIDDELNFRVEEGLTEWPY
jgi:hypothetical protein